MRIMSRYFRKPNIVGPFSGLIKDSFKGAPVNMVVAGVRGWEKQVYTVLILPYFLKNAAI